MSDEATPDDFISDRNKPDLVNLNPVKIEIPTNWEVRTIDSITTLVTDGAHQTPEYVEEGVRFLSTKNLNPGGKEFDFDEYERFITEKEHSKLCERVDPKEGDILISKSGTIGVTQLVRTDLDFSIFVGLSLIRPDTSVNSGFLEQILNWSQLRKSMRARSPGSTRSTLPIFATKQLEIPYASLSEQRKIATVLHTVDRAIEKTEEIRNQIQRVRDGVRQDIFLEGIDEQAQSESDRRLQETYLGVVPDEWQLKRVDEVCSHVVDCPHSTPDYTETGIPVVRTSEIEDGRFRISESPRVDQAGYEDRISRLEPQPGDVVFTREAPIGEAFKIPEDTKLCLGQRIMQLRPKDGVLDPDFLVELIYTDMMQSWFERSARGTTSTHVNVGDIKSMKIPVPPIGEQRKIVEVLGDFREKLESERKLIGRYNRIKQGLMQDLLSGEVRTTDKSIEVPDKISQYG